jgi:hypothetical protein
MVWTAERRGFVVEAYYENNRKNCFLCTFQKYIQFFFSRYLLSFFIPLQNMGDLHAPPCTSFLYAASAHFRAMPSLLPGV